MIISSFLQADAINEDDKVTASSMTGSDATALPAELWLEIIPYIPYHPNTLTSLRLVCRGLDMLITAHEQSLVSDLTTTQFKHQTSSLFPSLCLSHYSHLQILHHRLTTLNSIHAHWLQILACTPEFHWLRGRWITIHKAGLLLLYRLQDVSDKIALMEGLPRESLACLLFKLTSGVKILRVLGPQPVHMRFAMGDTGRRAEVEGCCEEMILRWGPEFFVELSSGKEGISAVRILNEEIANIEVRQLPTDDGTPPQPTLIASLRRALAKKCGCAVNECGEKMWEVLSATGFDEVDEGMLGRLVCGEEVERGMKRMGF